MITAFLVMLASPAKATAIFDASVTAQMRLKSYTVHIDIDTSIPGKHDQAQYDVAASGDKTLVRTRQPVKGQQDRSDRSFLLTSDKLVAYDALANERLQRPNSTHGSVASRLISLLGPVDDALVKALDPSQMKSFFAGFRGFADWNISRKGSTVTLFRSKQGSQTLFRFAEQSHLLREVSIKLKGGKQLHWTYSFKSGATVALHIPGDARRVSSFTVRPAPPRFTSAQAESLVNQMLKAYSKLRNGEVLINAPDEVSHIWLGGLSLREERDGFKWAYDGKVLSIWNKRSKKFYRGKAIRAVISEFIVAVGCEVDPLIRYSLAHRVPYGDLFPTLATVKVAGKVAIGGILSDILKVSTSSITESLFVQKSNHLLYSVEAEITDKAKHVQSENMKRFTYKHLGVMPESSLFRLDPGSSKVLPLPKIKGIN